MVVTRPVELPHCWERGVSLLWNLGESGGGQGMFKEVTPELPFHGELFMLAWLEMVSIYCFEFI